MHSNGTISIVGRLKDMIVRGYIDLFKITLIDYFQGRECLSDRNRTVLNQASGNQRRPNRWRSRRAVRRSSLCLGYAEERTNSDRRRNSELLQRKSKWLEL